MKLAIDVDYKGDKAFIAGVLFNDWCDDKPARYLHSIVDGIAPYEAGSFYKREMPCILHMIEKFNLEIDCLVVDGFVVLGKNENAGLGYHVWKALGEKIPVVGVAKNRYSEHDEKTEVYRGESTKPLMVTVAGDCLDNVKEKIKEMHGEFRIPTLLKMVDTECRSLAKANKE